jgi:hypothetical protein
MSAVMGASCSVGDATGRISVTGCPEGRAVGSPAELRSALSQASPGDVVVLRPGRYEGRFVADRPGTAQQPIELCGSDRAVIDGGAYATGYALHLDGADHWSVSGFRVTGAQKGIVVDSSSHVRLSGLRVDRVGDEAVHLRRGSSHNLVEGLMISRTGLHDPELGEGIYVGSAESGWCRLTDCEPDRSDDNRLVDNVISHTTAEAIDVKEGTTGGTIRGVRIDGSGTAADSLIDLKGNDWTVDGVRGAHAPQAGVAVLSLAAGWGGGNTVRRSHFAVPPDGWAVVLVGAAQRLDNTVACSTRATVAGRAASGRVTASGCRG